MNFDDLITRFDATHSGDGFIARCKAHDDQKASLSISRGADGRTLLHCHAGCRIEDVVQAVGLHMWDLFSPRDGLSRGQIVKTYDYHNADGELLYQVVRFDPKGFKQRRPEGSSGWIWSLKGITRVLYRLPELLSEGPEDTVYVVEGEKDVDRLIGLGFVATCNVGGAEKWRQSYSESLRDRHVVILPDNDASGRKHAADVSRKLTGIAASVRVLRLPDLPDKGDVSDWLLAGGTADELRRLAADIAPENGVAEDDTTAAQLAPSIDPFHVSTWTDSGNADRFVSEHGQDFLHCHPWRRWLVWDSRRWKVDETGTPVELAKSVGKIIQREACRRSDDKMFRFGVQSANEKKINAMLSLARSCVPVLPDTLNRHPMLFNAANGTIDLETGQLREFDRGDFLTTLCETAYRSDAKCPRWLQFLSEIFAGDLELVAFMQRLVGYSMIGEVLEHILPILFGNGSNGKSTLIETILQVLGKDYADTGPPELFVTSGKREHPTLLADLFGKRLVFANETDDCNRLNESQVKRITGGDTIKARRVHENYWSFTPTHTAFLATNHKPDVRGTDFGIWRRIKLIPFNVQFSDGNADPNLRQKLIAESEGILAWAVRGCIDWRRHGLGEPACVSVATRDYRDREDVISQFIADQCLTGQEQFKVKASQFREALKLWCESEGLQTPGPKQVGTFIESSAEFESFNSNGKWYRGIALRHSRHPTAMG